MQSAPTGQRWGPAALPFHSPSQTVPTHPPPRRIAVQAGAQILTHRHRPPRPPLNLARVQGDGSPPRGPGIPKGPGQRSLGPGTGAGQAPEKAGACQGAKRTSIAQRACHCPTGGCHSSTLLPSGSRTQPNFPYSESSVFSSTLHPSSRSDCSSAVKSSTR